MLQNLKFFDGQYDRIGKFHHFMQQVTHEFQGHYK